MEFSRQPPGDDIHADAYNLVVAASITKTQPDVAERVVRTITRRITDWEDIAAHLALVGAELAISDPETVRKAIESR
jgi:hypothetical protein